MARVTIKEWKRLLRFGRSLCFDLELKGINAKVTPYKGDQATSGLCIQALDYNGHVLKGYKSGTSRYDVMMMALAVGAKRLEREFAE